MPALHGCQRAGIAGSAGRRAFSGYTSPYFQYDRLGGVKETFGRDYISFGVIRLSGIDLVRGLDNDFRRGTEILTYARHA